jgi:hypothetical protein
MYDWLNWTDFETNWDVDANENEDDWDDCND